MPTTLDVYQPCPCGSGKKIKFCCQNIVPEMEKVLRLIDGQQHRAALHALETIEKKAPKNSWVRLTKAHMQLEENDAPSAKATLESLLKEHPDNGEAALLYANCCYLADGYAESIMPIQRALARASVQPGLAAVLVLRIGEELAVRGKYLAARQYLTLSVRWVNDQTREQVFARLIEMERDSAVFYPLRSVHHLQPWSGSPDEDKDFAKATRLAFMGCWHAAAMHFSALAEKHPEAAALWSDMGLCLAWVGHETGAAEALHKAAKTHGQHEDAVEAETLAQLLDHVNDAHPVRLKARSFTTPSVSRLLTKMSESPLLARDEMATEEESTDDAGRPFTAEFDVLDRPAPSEGFDRLSVHDLPLLLGTVMIYDGVPEKDIPARIELNASDVHFDAAEANLREAVGDDLQPTGDAVNAGGGLSRELTQLDRFHWLPTEGLAVPARRRLANERWKWVVDDLWANAPQCALGGKSPRAAVGDPDLVVPLKAAIHVLDAWSMQREHILDVSALCDAYQVPRPATIQPDADTELHNFSTMQFNRVAVDGLTDEQLESAVNRAMLVGHRGLLYKVLKAAAQRQSLHAKINMDRVYGGLVNIARIMGNREEALEWVRRGVEFARGTANSFELLLSWEISELSTRAEDPDDPEIPNLLRKFLQFYGKKVPQIVPVVERLCATFGIEIPSDAHEPQGGGLVGAGTTSAGGVWTPDGPSEAPKKLWLPGQD